MVNRFEALDLSISNVLKRNVNEQIALHNSTIEDVAQVIEAQQTETFTKQEIASIVRRLKKEGLR